jgi:DNA-binding transcriptional ArsR family regulator
MARAATTADVFNAVAEPRRREILNLIATRELPVNGMAHALGIAQPQVSKHLRVLREVDLVEVRGAGRQRLYRLKGTTLKPIHDWIAGFEHLWTERFEELDAVLDDVMQNEEETDDGSS